MISSVSLYCTCVRSFRFEVCLENQPVNFQSLAEGELEDVKGRLQVQDYPCHQQDKPTEYLRLVINSGWDDFCSVHRIKVEGVFVEKRGAGTRMSVRRGSKMGTSTDNVNDSGLEVSIPEHAAKDKN